jgi:hypothetical protein
MAKMDRKKKRTITSIGQTIKEIETGIPTSKSTNAADHKSHINYLLGNLSTLFEFYNFDNTARDNWMNYVSKQAVIEEAVNILISGGKKYYKNKRRKKGSKRRRRDSRKKKRAKHVGVQEQPQEQPLEQRPCTKLVY